MHQLDVKAYPVCSEARGHIHQYYRSPCLNMKVLNPAAYRYSSTLEKVTSRDRRRGGRGRDMRDRGRAGRGDGGERRWWEGKNRNLNSLYVLLLTSILGRKAT